MLTVLILVGYGGYSLWQALTDEDDPAGLVLPQGTGYLASTERAAFDGTAAIALGVNLRILRDVYHFRDDMNGLIGGVRAEQANLEAQHARARGTRADILTSSIQAMDELAVGMEQWRDAIFLVRLANVDPAESTINGAVTRLRADIDRWKALDG